jgi:hypothetical protein
MIGRTTGGSGNRSLEPTRLEIQGSNEGIDDANGIVVGTILV